MSLNQAGMVNNLKDGMAWGVFPLFFVDLHGLSLEQMVRVRLRRRVGVGW